MSEMNMQEENVESNDTDLELNTDIVHNRTTTYTSLSELYGVQLFTNQRLEEKRSYEADINLKERNVEESIFVNKSATKDIDRQVTRELFQEPLVIAKQQDYTGTTTASRGIFVAGAVLISIIFAMVFTNYLKPGKKKKKKITEEISNEYRKNRKESA